MIHSSVLFVALYLLAYLSTGCNNSVPDHGPRVSRGYVDPTNLDTGIPTLIVRTDQKRAITNKEQNIKAEVEFIAVTNPDHVLVSPVTIRGRGNTSWSKPKKPYQLKFAEEHSLLGMKKNDTWILLPNFHDPTLLMNVIAFELGHRLDLMFTNQHFHVDLVLNDVYEGNYLLTNKIHIGKGSVDIDQKNGFLVEMDSYYDKEPKFRTPILDLPIMIRSANRSKDSLSYKNARKTIEILEESMFNVSFPENGYRDLIDLDNAVNYILVNEILMNAEIKYPKSVFLFKDGGDSSRIRLGPIWDFDWAFGYKGKGREYFISTTTIPFPSVEPGQRFFDRFFDDPVFRKKYKERWDQMRPAISDMELFIDGMSIHLDRSQRMNYAVWIWNDELSYAEEIRKMKKWWRGRLEYMDRRIDQL